MTGLSFRPRRCPMARKKRKRDGNRSSGRPQPGPSADLPEVPDRRALEGRMWRDLLHEPGQEATPLSQAQDLAYQAFGQRDPRQRVRLAREALQICPDCADAHVLLAEEADSRKEALTLYEQGVAAGERALGPEAFREQAGHFWGLLPTRPYMRARQGLAFSLWKAGRRDDAVGHLQDMLRLNPNDNQGIRYTLA